MEYDNITSDEGEENHGGRNGIKNQPWLRKSEPVNKPIKISVIKSTISLPTKELNRKSQRSAVLNFRAIDSIGDSDVGDLKSVTISCFDTKTGDLNCQKLLIIVTKTFRLQHPPSTSL